MSSNPLMVRLSPRERAAARIAELADNASMASRVHGHSLDQRAQALRDCVDHLTVDTSQVTIDIIALRHLADWHREREGAYHKTMLPILFEAIAMLKSLQPAIT